MIASHCQQARRLTSRFNVAFFACLALAFAMPAAAAAPTASRPVLLHSVPRAVTVGRAARIKPMLGKRQLELAINLTLRNEDQLHALLKALYNPVSPIYHQYLSVQEFTARFAPTQVQYDAVIAWARAQGLSVTGTTRNRHIVDVRGSIRAINRALHVTMGVYRHPSKQRTFFAPDRDPRISLAVPVLKITGLNDFARPKPRLVHGTPRQRIDATARATGSGQGGEFLPSDMRAAYYGAGPLDGAGQTVAIFSFNGYLQSDLDLFMTVTNMTQTVPVHNVLVGTDGACVDVSTGLPPCSDGESILDIGNVMGMAPGLTQILFYEGPSGADTLNRIATDNIAKVISCSWGSTSLGPAVNPIFLQFQAQGQTFVTASGDSGAFTTSNFLPPSLNPNILQVGGTGLTTTGPGGSWMSEIAWSSSGGGFLTSDGYPIPAYQQLSGVINGLNGGSTTRRNAPDVAAEGDFDNPTVSNGHVSHGVGGTSYAAPRWAGFIALANQQALANGGSSFGFLNPALYAIGVGGSYDNDFNDVSTGGNGFAAVAGYDLVTGWGSPRGANLIDSLLLSGSTADPGFVLATPDPALEVARGSNSAITTLTVHGINGFSGNVALAAINLPVGVNAQFSPASTTTSSTLTLTATAGATLGRTTITINGTSGNATTSMPIRLLVGNVPVATFAPSLAFANMVPLGTRSGDVVVANAVNSVDLTYSAAAFASGGGACSGSITWLSLANPSGSIRGGDEASVVATAVPSAASLSPGNYSAEICITTNDPAQSALVVPVSLSVVRGPLSDRIFSTGFETGSARFGEIFTFTLNQPVENTQAGSAIDLATGEFHTWSPAILDNINLYNNGGNGLAVYWYDDQLPRRPARRVGGVVDTGGDYIVMQSGEVVGPGKSFDNAATDMPNWTVGTDGYLGIEFFNSQTDELNYGYIHITTTASNGFPAQIIGYGYDQTGAAITIP